MFRETNFAHFYRLLRDRAHYRRLVLGGVVSQLGDWLSYIALTYIAVREGGEEGAAGVGLAIAGTYLAHTLPHAIVAPFVGPLVDRVSRRALIIGSYLGASALTLLIWSQAHSGSLLMIQALICLRVMMSSVGSTARQAALPTLVSPSELYLANTLNSSVWSALFTLGVALGGVLSALLGPREAILIDAMTYLVSCALVWRLPTLSPDDRAGAHAVEQLTDIDPTASTEATTHSSQRQAQAPQDHVSSDSKAPRESSAPYEASAHESSVQGPKRLTDAARFVKMRAALKIPLLAKIVIGIFNGGGWIALNVIATTRHPESGAMLIGLFTAARGLGMGVGPAALKAGREVSPIPLMGLAFGAISVFIFTEQLWLSLCVLFLWGVANGLNWVSATAKLQSETPPSLLGRMTSLDFLCFTTTQSLTTLGAGWLYDRGLSIGEMFTVVSALGLIGTVLLYLLKRSVEYEVESAGTRDESKGS